MGVRVRSLKTELDLCLAQSDYVGAAVLQNQMTELSMAMEETNELREYPRLKMDLEKQLKLQALREKDDYVIAATTCADCAVRFTTRAAACLLDPGSYHCGSGEAVLPPWDDLPLECGFKRLRPGVGDKTRRMATAIDKKDDRQRYAMYTTWAMKTCGVTDATCR